MEKFNLGQLTKEMVLARLSELKDPCDAAADIMAKALLVVLKDIGSFDAEQRQVVVAVCRGTMIGLLLGEASLTRGALAILHKACDVAKELHLDPTDMMRLALEGIAGVRRFVTKERLGEISIAIDAEFMGAGSAFTAIMEQTTQPIARPGKP